MPCSGCMKVRGVISATWHRLRSGVLMSNADRRSGVRRAQAEAERQRAEQERATAEPIRRRRAF
jgi:hypothetical protein